MERTDEGEPFAFSMIFKKKLCHRKRLILFSLKLQRDNRQNALAVDPAKGKTGKKMVEYKFH